MQYFIAVAEELHFGRAAMRLHIAEQPLGYQVRKLEDELGFKLLDRTTRSVSLTPAGASFLEDARRIVERAELAADNARRIADGKAGTIRLGYESATVVSVLPDYVRLFRAEYPEIDLVLSEYSMAGIAALLAGETDACLVTRYERLPKGVEYVRIKPERVVVALPAGHRLEGKAKVTLSELAGEAFLGYGGYGSGSVNLFLNQVAQATETDVSVSQEAETYIALLGFVAAGLGFTIVTGSMESLFHDRVVYRPLANPKIKVDCGLALREGEQMPAAESLRIVARHLAKLI